MRSMRSTLGQTILCLTVIGCAGPAAIPAAGATVQVDSARVLADVAYLSQPGLEGRATGTAGNVAARQYIEAELREAGVEPFAGRWTQTFTLARALGSGPVEGANVIGFVRGTVDPDRYVVLTAHYDHLGVRGGVVYPGADDNASGTAALLEIARHYAANPGRHSLIVAALDAEEIGLRGARAFVADPPVPIESILLNVNLDMVSRNVAGELYVAGTYPYPFLAPLVERMDERSPLTVLAGHDRPDGSAGDDWTGMSDHGAFHDAGIPFLYLGVEDHVDYHQPTDVFENIDPSFFVQAVDAALELIGDADLFLERAAASPASPIRR